MSATAADSVEWAVQKSNLTTTETRLYFEATQRNMTQLFETPYAFTLTYNHSFSLALYLYDRATACPIDYAIPVSASTFAAVFDPILVVANLLMNRPNCTAYTLPPPVSFSSYTYVGAIQASALYASYVVTDWLAPIPSIVAAVAGRDLGNHYAAHVFEKSSILAPLATIPHLIISQVHILVDNLSGATLFSFFLPRLPDLTAYAGLAWCLHAALFISLLAGRRSWWQLPLAALTRAAGAAWFAPTNDPVASAIGSALLTFAIDEATSRLGANRFVRAAVLTFVMGEHGDAMFRAGFVPGKPLTSV